MVIIYWVFLKLYTDFGNKSKKFQRILKKYFLSFWSIFVNYEYNRKYYKPKLPANFTKLFANKYYKSELNYCLCNKPYKIKAEDINGRLLPVKWVELNKMWAVKYPKTRSIKIEDGPDPEHSSFSVLFKSSPLQWNT